MKKILAFLERAAFRIPAGAVLGGAGLAVSKAAPETGRWVAFGLYLAALLLCGWPVFVEAVQSLFHHHGLDETFLMSIAAIGAFAIGQYFESVMVLLLYLIGEEFEHLAVRRSRRSISSLLDICPDTATVLVDGKEVQKDADEVQVGEVLVLHPGDRVPVDCTVTEGESTLDTSAITGEAAPRHAAPGTAVQGGVINLSGRLLATATQTAENSCAGRILAMVEEAGERKSRQETFVRRFARVYTPCVVGAALLLAFIPPFFTGWDSFAAPGGWLYRALTLLVVSCPCALVISVPLSFFGGIGGASSAGILYKGGNAFSPMAHCKTAVFDKTGTLTTGAFTLSGAECYGMERGTLLHLAAVAEEPSNHPIAAAVKQPDAQPPEDFREIAGRGIAARVEGHDVLVGNVALLRENGVEVHPTPMMGCLLYVAVDGVHRGTLSLTDEIKPGMQETLQGLRKSGVRRLVMLTGDGEENARPVGEALGFDEVHAALLPQQKYAYLDDLIAKGDGVLYVGDGINDAPSLARADVGVAMGESALDAAVEAADVVIPGRDPRALLLSRRVARKTLRIATENIVFTLVVKAAALILTATGLLPNDFAMIVALFADVGVALIAILNAMRCLNKPKL